MLMASIYIENMGTTFRIVLDVISYDGGCKALFMFFKWHKPNYSFPRKAKGVMLFFVTLFVIIPVFRCERTIIYYPKTKLINTIGS